MRTVYISRCDECANHEPMAFSNANKAALHAAEAAAANSEMLPEHIANSIVPPNRRIGSAFVEVVHYPD